MTSVIVRWNGLRSRALPLGDAFACCSGAVGAAGVVDLLACVGYFAMLAVTHKALEVFPEGT